MIGLKGYIFDMDGILADTESAHQLAESMTLSEFGVSLDDSDKEMYTGVNEAFFWSDLDRRFNLGDPIGLASKSREFFFKVAEGISAFDGVTDVLDHIRSTGSPIAVASSSDRVVVDFVLARLGIRDFFSAIVTGDEVLRDRKSVV